MNKDWFVFKGTHHLGPFSVEEIAEFYREGEISATTLVWREGVEKWEPVSKVSTFQFIFNPVETKTEIKSEKNHTVELVEIPPPPPISRPHIPSRATLPKAPVQVIQAMDEDDLPPPIPLDAILDPKGEIKLKIKTEEKSSRYSRIALSFGLAIFILIIGWFALNERQAGIQLRIKGLMPVYLEKLEATATKNSPQFDMAMALSLDSLSLWASTNFSEEMNVIITLDSIPKKVLGTEDVSLKVKGEIKNHVGKFTKMVLVKGSKFLPGEYNVEVEARAIHAINSHFKSLSGISFFRSLNKTYHYSGRTLIFPGTPREFDKKIDEYSLTITSEMLKPFQDKLERVQTFESILNQTSQNFLMELEKAKTGKAISSFENKFMKEISPLLQSLVVKAIELSKDPAFDDHANPSDAIAPYQSQVMLGKQIGEMASDMITHTQKFKKLTDKNKADLRAEFDKRARAIKVQIDNHLKKLDEKIQKISK